MTTASYWLKRTFDIGFSLLALSLFAFPMLIIGILLRFKEGHPILFKQIRLGKDKGEFEILKFQTLVDERPTPTGAILRRTGIDEWPQFINVLRGEMSIVGPRALTPKDIQRLKWDDKFHAPRWTVKPGITGYAQLYGGQHRKTSWFWDAYYLAHGNVLHDLGILILSFLMNLFGKKRIRRIVFRKNNLK